MDWLEARPEVARRRIGLIGVSKGGEAVLLVAARDRRACAVIAAVPASVAFAGYDPGRNLPSAKSSWSWAGRRSPTPATTSADFRPVACAGAMKGAWRKRRPKR